jgi:hypothetical protein
MTLTSPRLNEGSGLVGWHFIDNSAVRLATCARRHPMRYPIWHDWRESGTRATTHLNAPRKQRHCLADINPGDEPPHDSGLGLRRYNARVQRPPADALKCALYRSRSACNEMLGNGKAWPTVNVRAA